MVSILERVVTQAEYMSGAKNLTAQSAIDQDMGISGDDVTEFAEWLAKEFGDHVWQWPWHRFAELNEGLGCFFLPGLMWMLITWPIRGSFNYPSPFERLELGHIAAVIEKGEWFEP